MRRRRPRGGRTPGITILSIKMTVPLTVACSSCNAPAGTWCVTKNGATASAFHVARTTLAVDGQKARWGNN